MWLMSCWLLLFYWESTPCFVDIMSIEILSVKFFVFWQKWKPMCHTIIKIKGTPTDLLSSIRPLPWQSLPRTITTRISRQISSVYSGLFSCILFIFILFFFTFNHVYFLKSIFTLLKCSWLAMFLPWVGKIPTATHSSILA